jgi:chromosomal replication initiator protein
MTPSIADIQARVARFYGLPHPDAMKGPIRSRKHAWPRQVAMYLSRSLTDKSYPNIGLRFGGRDHTTVIHAFHAVEKRRAADPELNNAINLLEREFAA